MPRVQSDRISEHSKMLIMSAHAQKAVRLQAFCVHVDECLQGTALNYTHLQLAACNSSQQDEQKSPNILVQMALWIADLHSPFNSCHNVSL